MRWCELNRIDYLFGLARNERLTAAIAAELQEAQQLGERTGKPARRFKDLTWSTLDSWSRTRRVVAKAEWTGGEANPRFVVTSLSRTEHEARHLYEKVYCAHGDMENRSRNASSTCSPTAPRPPPMRVNQLRLWFAAMAYVLGLDPRFFGTHSLRRTEATLIYRWPGNLQAVQLLRGKRKIESTGRYPGIEVDDALAIAELPVGCQASGR